MDLGIARLVACALRLYVLGLHGVLVVLDGYIGVPLCYDYVLFGYILVNCWGPCCLGMWCVVVLPRDGDGC